MAERVLRVGDIEHFHWTVSEADGPITFSANGDVLSLAAAVELACIQAQAQRDKNLSGSTIRVAKCPSWALLKASRWPSDTKQVKLRKNGTVVMVLPAKANDIWWDRCFVELFKELKASGFPVDLARALTGAVGEIADNVWQHSDSPEPGLLAYTIRRRKFAFSMADTGIGVLESLRKNPQYSSLSSSMEAIKTAIKPGVSCLPEGSGTGFQTLLDALADLWGNARLRSGEAGLLIDGTQKKRRMDYRYLPYLPGLHVSVRCILDASPARQS